MSNLNETPRSNRLHIALFGKTNAGKSSIINALTGQNISLVSEIKGTTTDPVYKAMELLPLGPIVLIDTAGLDDETELGDLRKKKTMDVLNKTDIALIVINGCDGISSFDLETINHIKSKNIPVMAILNKSDLSNVAISYIKNLEEKIKIKVISASATKKIGIDNIKNELIKLVPDEEDKFRIVGDLISPGDFVVLVTPIDKAAPKGRLILPQQQVIRDILESDAISIVTKEYELRETLENLNKKPRLVITDSQAFLKVSADTPKDISLTSFSILFARNKGDLIELVKGAKAINSLKDGDKILVSEACTHHRQSDDIGKVKIPRWLRQTTGKDLSFEFSSGFSFPENIKDYSLVVHCAGCMLNRAAMLHRISSAVDAGVPIVNYGVLIAYVHGILERALKPFPSAKFAFEED
ncbi:[FeFe] hydrogenase H-cluster maturation GTPase HydF [Clostridium sp.]|uniref:[FeFe] hydrogenase H-cluster maturation GTPase HydF n=1 Tax=Clostridium sp. TaxID=1506 RepID=UPI0025864792|nr:[FeFe] hydrogenase H-cluster maturation GTPase HydF [Clostridium sp.]MDF2502704.1 hydrogenase maturation GTPase HydF [Clostridium sp.]